MHRTAASALTPLGARLDYFDLQFLGQPGIIPTRLLSGSEGVALTAPGPSTTRATLGQALESRGDALRDVRAILLTHIHLDPAACTGTLTGECPDAKVFVHGGGERHL